MIERLIYLLTELTEEELDQVNRKIDEIVEKRGVEDGKTEENK